MRAIVVRTYGGPEALELITVDTPEPGKGQVRIKVAAAAVNPIDVATRAGALAAVIGDRPVIGLGWDVAGTIDVLGPGVTRFAVGDAVIGLRDTLAVDLGTYAEYVVLDAAAVAPAPASVNAVAASTLPLNALTAEQALDLLGLEAGATMLVTGAAGGLGGYTVTLARRRGLRVVAVAAPQDAELVRGFGAEWFVARSDDLAEAVRTVAPGGVDGALDPARVGTAALDAVRDGGRFVAVTDWDRPEAARGISVQTVYVHHDGRRLAELARVVDAGELLLRVAATLPLTEASDAHRLLEKGGLRGRVVLVP